jgi:hypothetical protein
VFLLLLMTLLFIDAPPLAAQEPVPEPSWSDRYVASGGVGTMATLLLVFGIVAATAAGMLAARRPDPWPLWPALVRGLGDAAFLCSLIATFEGLRKAMEVIARLGAAVTPADLAEGLAHSFATLVFGAVAALAGLCGAALLRWRRPS